MPQNIRDLALELERAETNTFCDFPPTTNPRLDD